jgi:hypothetical protein
MDLEACNRRVLLIAWTLFSICPSSPVSHPCPFAGVEYGRLIDSEPVLNRTPEPAFFSPQAIGFISFRPESL